MKKERPLAPYDFHLHTWWSYDATAEVEEHFRRARELGIRCLAITEHHHLDSLPTVLKAAKGYPEVRAIPAAELTVTSSIGDVDLLCYNLPTEPAGTPLAPVIERYHQWQRAAGSAISDGMCRLGFAYPDEVRLQLLRTYRPEAAIHFQGVTHVNNHIQRRFFVEKGFLARESDYPALMKQVAREVDVPPYPPVAEVVEAVQECGGLIVIAHPQGYFAGADQARMDRLKEECALDGIECAHPDVAIELTPIYRNYCRRHGLLSLAGSDCHSPNDIQTVMGRHGGEPEWLEEFLARLS